jgi:hypothetical protein
MTETKSGARRPRRHEGLPDEDEGLDALSALASSAFRPAQQSRPLAALPQVVRDQPTADIAPATGAPAAAALPPAASAAQSATVPQVPLRATGDEGPADGAGMEDFIRQSTVNVDASVAERFRRFQKRSDPAPSNAEIIFLALEAADGHERQIVDARRPALPEGRRFGRAVPGRRPAGTRLTVQINFRPTIGELQLIKQLTEVSGAGSVSSFVNAMLDEFLPAGRTPRG